jgi:hypothetical protein
MSLPPSRLYHVEDIGKAMAIFWEDIFACKNLLFQHPNNQTWQRLLIRTIFASIDLWCKNLNKVSFDDYIYQIGSLDENDILFLKGKKLSSVGKETDKTIKFGKYFENSLRIHAQIQGVKFKLEKKSEWRSFLVAISIRNRITHPNSSYDLILNPHDFKLALNGCLWAIKCIGDMFGLLPGNAPS